MNAHIENPQVYRLAKALNAAFSIDKSNSLVGLLGSGSEASNQQALLVWVVDNLSNPNEQIAEVVLPHLVTRMDMVLRHNRR